LLSGSNQRKPERLKQGVAVAMNREAG